ncbi:hypothetical protein P691DRAFT_607514, partial [Macrolepiota fuliginosa MF-IS2]
IPPECVLGQLRSLLHWAWMDGAKSIADPHYNEGRGHVPLWAVTFWKQIQQLYGHQRAWHNSLKWLE